MTGRARLKLDLPPAKDPLVLLVSMLFVAGVGVIDLGVALQVGVSRSEWWAIGLLLAANGSGLWALAALWNTLFGRESIVLDERTLSRTKTVLGFAFQDEFERAAVRGVRARRSEPSLSDFRGPSLEAWGFRRGRLAFDYLGSEVWIGSTLTDEQLNELRSELDDVVA